jgi:ketosteroid isomerase-like protein
VIEKYFECVNSADWDTWLTLFAEDAIMDDALSPRMQGHAALKASTEGIAQGFQKFQNHLVEMVVEGDKGMVICRIDAVTAAGAPIDSTGANFYRVQDGKIAYMASFHDSAPFVRAFSAGGS